MTILLTVVHCIHLLFYKSRRTTYQTQNKITICKTTGKCDKIIYMYCKLPSAKECTWLCQPVFFVSFHITAWFPRVWKKSGNYLIFFKFQKVRDIIYMPITILRLYNVYLFSFLYVGRGSGLKIEIILRNLKRCMVSCCHWIFSFLFGTYIHHSFNSLVLLSSHKLSMWRLTLLTPLLQFLRCLDSCTSHCLAKHYQTFRYTILKYYLIIF